MTITVTSCKRGGYGKLRVDSYLAVQLPASVSDQTKMQPAKCLKTVCLYSWRNDINA